MLSIAARSWPGAVTLMGTSDERRTAIRIASSMTEQQHVLMAIGDLLLHRERAWILLARNPTL